MDWLIVFMLIALKLPIVYLCGVVWWAIKAEPQPPRDEVGAALEPSDDPGSPWTWWRQARRRRPPRPGPHSSPARRAARPGRPAPSAARAQRR